MVVAIPAAAQPTTVRIGLFQGRTPQTIQINGYGGLRVSGRAARGTLTVSCRGNQVVAKDAHGAMWGSASLTVASRGGRFIDVEGDGLAVRRTIGYLQIRLYENRLQIVNVLPIETYVLGVVEPELGSLQFNPESMKAQIVASRSYLLATRNRHRSEGFDFCDRPHCQVYGGTHAINQAFKQAMQETRGQFLAYAGKPIPAFFHDNCGGRTASMGDAWHIDNAPYLASVEDDYCKTAPRHHWTYRIDRRILRQALAEAGWIQEFDALSALRVVSFNSSGRADQVCIQTNQPRWVPADEFRQALNRHIGSEVIPSTLFMVKKDQQEFLFVGRGWGHGVGLCQWGAIEMARAGKSYKQILRHFYPGTSFDRLPDAAPPRSFLARLFR
jgi:stage II sporulation protein D